MKSRNFTINSLIAISWIVTASIALYVIISTCTTGALFAFEFDFKNRIGMALTSAAFGLLIGYMAGIPFRAVAEHLHNQQMIYRAEAAIANELHALNKQTTPRKKTTTQTTKPKTPKEKEG